MTDQQRQANASSTSSDTVPYAWIEGLDQECIYIGTDENLAAFRRRDLPARWCERFRTAAGNLILAQEIDSRGSPGDTPLELVVRLSWPLSDATVTMAAAALRIAPGPSVTL
jgi:hypothetical protein